MDAVIEGLSTAWTWIAAHLATVWTWVAMHLSAAWTWVIDHWEALFGGIGTLIVVSVLGFLRSKIFKPRSEDSEKEATKKDDEPETEDEDEPGEASEPEEAPRPEIIRPTQSEIEKIDPRFGEIRREADRLSRQMPSRVQEKADLSKKLSRTVIIEALVLIATLIAAYLIVVVF